MEINENLFDLTPDQIEMSKTIYDGKIIKCLVAPYHTYGELEKIVPYTRTTFLFPEREMNSDRIRSLVSMIVNHPSNEEFRIITASQSVILDMVDGNVRILTEGGSVVPCPIKTFMANIHDIRYKVLENPAHRISEEEKNKQHEYINNIFKIIDGRPTMNMVEYQDLMDKIDLIGEELIRHSLKKHAGEKIKIA